MSGFISNAMQAIFGAPAVQQQAPVQQPAQKTPGNIPNNPETVANPNNPSIPMDTGVAKPPESPLDQFQSLWQTDPNAKVTPPVGLFANLKPEDVHAAARNNDFTKVITPEMQAAINKGGPEAIQATFAAMNAMSQKGFGDAALATTRIVEDALKKQKDSFLAELPNIIKGQNRPENLRSANPVFSNPAVTPMLDMMQTQVALKHPTLSAAEQSKMAQDYVLAFAQAVNPAKQTQSSSDSSTDWSQFLQ